MNENKLNEARVARIHEAFASVPYAKFLGLELGEMKPGEANLHLEVRDELRQNRGVVHGGAVASLIDTATARTVRAGRRLFVLSVEVMDNQQKLIATAVTTYIKLQ